MVQKREAGSPDRIHESGAVNSKTNNILNTFDAVYSVQRPLDSLLKDGKVILSVKGGVTQKKAKYPDPLLILQTTESINLGSGGLLLTLVGYSSRLLDRDSLKVSQLILMGLNAVAARLLINELKTLFNK